LHSPMTLQSSGLVAFSTVVVSESMHWIRSSPLGQ
jgi:hypothetical protein